MHELDDTNSTFPQSAIDPKMIDKSDWVTNAYANGMPMGGDLPAKPTLSSAPRLVLKAVKDPDGASLDPHPDHQDLVKSWRLPGKGL